MRFSNMDTNRQCSLKKSQLASPNGQHLFSPWLPSSQSSSLLKLFNHTVTIENTIHTMIPMSVHSWIRSKFGIAIRRPQLPRINAKTATRLVRSQFCMARKRALHRGLVSILSNSRKQFPFQSMWTWWDCGTLRTNWWSVWSLSCNNYLQKRR